MFRIIVNAAPMLSIDKGIGRYPASLDIIRRRTIKRGTME